MNFFFLEIILIELIDESGDVELCQKIDEKEIYERRTNVRLMKRCSKEKEIFAYDERSEEYLNLLHKAALTRALVDSTAKFVLFWDAQSVFQNQRVERQG